jgi:hypothetical protein
MKKRCIGFLLACFLLFGILPLGAVNAASLNAAPYLNITYNETSGVSAGTIRYVSQLTSSPRFYSSYWDPYVDGAGHECYTAAISMALSAIGLNATPAALGLYWTDQGHTGGEPFTTVQWDVGHFGAAYLSRSFARAMQAYRDAPGTFSPPIIHLTSYSERGHYVVVAGQLSDSVYMIVDPANDSTWNATIQNNVVSYTRNGDARSEELEPATQYQRTGAPALTAPSAPTTTPEPTVTTVEPTKPVNTGVHTDGLSCVSAAFVDVPGESDWSHAGIDYCIKTGLMQGTDARHFCPDTRMTRAMMVTVLYRAAGAPDVSGYPNPFGDLTENWYRNAVVWAYHMGVTDGVKADRFAPNEFVSREQLVVMLYRYRQLTSATPAKINALDAFHDASLASCWAAEALRWAVTSGVLTGTSATKLSPSGSANRAQMATILMRFQNLG